MDKSNQNITDDDLIIIVAELNNYTGAEKISLNLSCNCLTAKSNVLLRSLIEKNILVSLNLSNNKFDESTWEMLGLALDVSTLEELELGSSNLRDQGVRLLLRNVNNHSRLHTLNLFNNNITDDGAIDIARILIASSSIRTLNLCYNNIHAAGVLHLANSLKVNRTLDNLNLRSNPIGPEGAKHLAESITTHPSLRILELYSGGIGNLGALFIVRALHNNTVLEELNLGDNQISDQATQAISEMIIANRALKQLDVSENSIKDTGAKYLATALNSNSTIILLNISANHIESETLVVFENNKSRVLYVYNDYDPIPGLRPTLRASVCVDTHHIETVITEPPPNVIPSNSHLVHTASVTPYPPYSSNNENTTTQSSSSWLGFGRTAQVAPLGIQQSKKHKSRDVYPVMNKK